MRYSNELVYPAFAALLRGDAAAGGLETSLTIVAIQWRIADSSSPSPGRLGQDADTAEPAAGAKQKRLLRTFANIEIAG
jgi:hypothetical protein